MALTPGYGSGGTESSGGAFVFSGTSSISPVAGDGALPQGCNEHLVSSPEGGAAAVDEEICSAEMEPVLAKGAALIHLEVTSNDPRLATAGTLTFPEALRDRAKGEPIVSVDRTVANLDGVVSALTQTDEGYSFKVTFGPDVLLVDNDQTRVSLRASFDYECDTGSRLVSAVTELRLCGGFPTPVTWSGPGDTCVVCVQYQPNRP